MIDMSCWSNNCKADVQVFSNPSTVTNTQWATWRKPRGATMAYIFCLGGGAGGGGGFGAGAGAARGGGGGGGSSACLSLICPIFLLPDILYVQVGAGGAGGGPAAVGTAGVLSYVSVSPSTIANNIVATSGSIPGGGGAGTGAAVGAAGTAGGAAGITSMIFAGLGTFVSVAGQVGGAGGAVAGAAGTSITLPVTGLVTTGGAGGAGTTSADFAGGGFNATANTFVSEQRPATPAAGSNNGASGTQLWKPFYGFGGCGGSSSNTTVGGNGGAGALGCGGGGGGGGVTTGGRGGNGGNGIVFIISY